MPDNCLEHCAGCGLPGSFCCCEQVTPHQSQLQIALLLHENEPQRPTTTSKIIQKVLPATETYIWQRKEPPQQLIEKIKDKETDAWLLFPADRPDLISRKNSFCGVNPGRKALIIIPDGTWKEVRKIVRKSPWLDQLPLLAFDPQTPSRYDLRRNPDADHLCTAETVVELLKLNNELDSAMELDRTVDLFIDGYKTSKRA